MESFPPYLIIGGKKRSGEFLEGGSRVERGGGGRKERGVGGDGRGREGKRRHACSKLVLPSSKLFSGITGYHTGEGGGTTGEIYSNSAHWYIPKT